MKTRLAAVSTAFGILLCASTASAINVAKDEEKHRSLDVGLLLQPQMQITKDGAPDASSTSTDFFLRRARLIVSGEVMQGLTFFFDTDQPNWGKNGAWNGAFIVQDAFASYEVRRELTFDAGFMLVPFTHHTLEGAASLHAIDYHAAMIHFPAGVGPAFRDGGVQARGLLFDDRVHYRLAVFEGVRGPGIATPAPPAGSPGAMPLNAAGEPRFAAQVRFNILGVEDKFFLKGIYFADKPMLSVGAGYDYQRHSTRIPLGISNHSAVSADAFFEYPLSQDQEILAKAAFVHYEEGTNSIATGNGGFGEAGFRYKWLEPLVGGDAFHALGGLQDYYAVRGGVNFWLSKHAANIKAEVAYTIDDRPTAVKRDLVGTLQGQIFF